MPWLYLLMALVVAAVVAWIVAESPKRTRPGGPDFILRPRGGSLWEIERAGNTTAFAVSQGDGIVSGSHFRPEAGIGRGQIGDLQPGERRNVTMPNDSSCWVWFDWIADGSRRYTKSQHVTPGSEELKFVGIIGNSDAPFQT